ncbi:hypothetical protein NDU88_006600 [Pleurodeles waltl]|uniref:TIR domain-containing protein n=1 Tax=Pleurodeles waltl TaxID=8319 RepID=A0AAV7L695_PLEWA|nr:hypothetical protein NDU88_006600 [Pleurodeles waltl]
MTSSSYRYDFSLWYCEEDEDIASCICHTLEQQGFRGYCEHRDQVAGMLVVSTICEVIQASRAAILVLSRRTIGDRWRQRITEWNLVNIVQGNAGKIIPVYVDITRDQGPLTLRWMSSLTYSSKFFKKRLLESLKSRR